MICTACGNPVAAPGAFCTRCGVQAPYYAATGPMSPLVRRPRVAQHVQTLGILWFVYGVYRAASGAFAALVLAGFSHGRHFGSWGEGGELWSFPHGPLFGALAGVVLVYTAISALLAFVVGYALTTGRPYGRMLAIVAAIIALIRPITGTALGIYTLWVLAPAASAAEYDALISRG